MRKFEHPASNIGCERYQNLVWRVPSRSLAELVGPAAEPVTVERDRVMAEVVKNVVAHQYEMQVGEHTVLVQFSEETDGGVRLLHTEVPVALEGQGVGSRLARAVLDSIRAEGQHVVPQCSFITRYIQRHPEYRDLVQP